MCHWHRNRKGFYWCYKLLCYFSVPSLKYSVGPLSSPRLTKHTVATEQPWIHWAILPSSQERSKRGWTKEGGQPITQASTSRSDTSGTVGSPPLISLISAKPIRQTPRVKFLFSVAVRVWQNIICVRTTCLRVRETILNGTNNLRIHPHTVHLISMKMQNAKKK